MELATLLRPTTLVSASCLLVGTLLVPSSAPARAEVEPARPGEIQLVFRAGDATYLRLADLAALDREPRHGRPHLVGKDGEYDAIAPVRAGAVPAYRAWVGRDVIVDGSCRARVTELALVSRLVGDPGYAGLESGAWDTASVQEHGRTVLAGKLDHCTLGTFARDAALPPVIVPIAIEDSQLAARARAALILSQPAQDTQLAWTQQKQAGAWWDHATFSTQVMRHPVTGVTWVSVYGHISHGCGDPGASVWGLYRVGPGGALVPAQLRVVEELDEIDQLVDLDGDGELEVIGKPWLGLDVVVERASGFELQRLDMHFFGCPC
jgi:hypothetical protein